MDDEDEEKGIMHDEFFKSNFEKRKEKVRQELDVLESEQVGDRPWHLMGETSAKNREGDELLGMDLDFDATRPDVVPTVEMTEDLEKIIIQRIRDKGTDLVMVVYLAAILINHYSAFAMPTHGPKKGNIQFIIQHMTMSKERREKWLNPQKQKENLFQMKNENHFHSYMNKNFYR